MMFFFSNDTKVFVVQSLPFDAAHFYKGEGVCHIFPWTPVSFQQKSSSRQRFRSKIDNENIILNQFLLEKACEETWSREFYEKFSKSVNSESQTTLLFCALNDFQDSKKFIAILDRFSIFETGFCDFKQIFDIRNEFSQSWKVFL